MKQILLNLKNGKSTLDDVPSPLAKKGQVLIKTTRSLVSLGTERMLVEFGKANLIQKARQQPHKVKMVRDKIKSDGLMPTLETVINKLDQPLPLGYCNVGQVIEVGEGVTRFNVGDRVASNGHHAEFVAVPQNLVAHIPDEVSDDEAAFTVIGSIGLQGIRLLSPSFGETIVVIGLGLVGLISAKLLVANGCRVIGIDLDTKKLEIARRSGITIFDVSKGKDPVKFIESITNGIGADGVIITAFSKSNDVISQSARMSRKQGRIILTGVVGLNISRADFFEKELTFQVSCSYGPGSYDDNYKQKGQDYPLAYVRWTARRNFESILSAIKSKSLDVQSLISKIIKIEDFKDIYDNINNSDDIATLLKYPEESLPLHTISLHTNQSVIRNNNVLGIVGAGNFTKMTLLPSLKSANIKFICSARGVNSTVLAKKHGISNSTTDINDILNDEEVDTVLITTRHHLHASMTVQSLKAGKNVFVEKPLALNITELHNIIEAYESSNCSLTVGFNRRFSPHTEQIKLLIDEGAPKNIVATMNAGFVPGDSWVQDLEIGGGRIISEACHFIDLITFLTGSKVKSVCMSALGRNPEKNTENATLLLKYENGDQGAIHYFSNGNRAYSRERIEVYSQEKTIITDNFRITRGYGTPGFTKLKTKLDRGHRAQFAKFLDRSNNGDSAIIPFDEIINTTKASFAALQSLKESSWIEIN